MKRNKRLSKYGQKLVSGTEKRDRAEFQGVRTTLLDVSAFARGLAQQIVDENSEGNVFLYDQFERRSRSYFLRLNTHVSKSYDAISRGVSKRSKDIYLFYRKELAKTLTGVKFAPKIKPLTEAEINVSFGGTPNQSFTKHLRRQLQVGQDPAALIKTLGPEHVKLIQREMAIAVSKGKGFGWATDKVLKQMYPAFADEAIRKRMEYNVTRIARTSYMQAVNADTSEFVFDNQDTFFGSRRVADGRPCIACIAQDGRFYKPDEMLIDHPNGMCILVPMPYPDEYLLDGKITKPIEDVFDEPLAQKFYKMGAGEQRKVFANDLLYRLWQKERFDLDKVVVGKFGGPISYRQAVLNLDVMGGISEARVGFRSAATRKSLLNTIDPKDRLNPNFVISKKAPIGGVTYQGLVLKGDGFEFLSLNRISTAKRARIAALYGEEANLPWYVFNRRARELGIYTRRSVTGKTYYSVPKKVSKEQFMTTKKLYKLEGDAAWGKRFAYHPTANAILDTFDSVFAKTIKTRKMQMKGKKSSVDYYKDASGNILPERAALHKKIIDKFINKETIARAQAAPGKAPEYIMFGGRGGSGKSAFTRKKSRGGLEVVDEDRFVILDTDTIKEALVGTEWKELQYEGWNSFLFHDESKEIFEKITELALKHRLNLVHDMTLSTPAKAIKKAQAFMDKGYDISGYYMHLPPQEATNRALMRFYTRNRDFSGRLVPPEVVLEMIQNEAAFEALKPLFKRWAFYDNQGVRGSVPELLGSFGF